MGWLGLAEQFLFGVSHVVGVNIAAGAGSSEDSAGLYVPGGFFTHMSQFSFM